MSDMRQGLSAVEQRVLDKAAALRESMRPLSFEGVRRELMVDAGWHMQGRGDLERLGALAILMLERAVALTDAERKALADADKAVTA